MEHVFLQMFVIVRQHTMEVFANIQFVLHRVKTEAIV